MSKNMAFDQTQKQINEMLSKSFSDAKLRREGGAEKINSSPHLNTVKAFLALSEQEQYDQIKKETEYELIQTGGMIFARTSMVQFSKDFGYTDEAVELTARYEEVWGLVRGKVIQDLKQGI